MWEKLFEIDPVRAQQISKGDTYRVVRALEIWKSQGVKPSEFAPRLDLVGPAVLVIVKRDREQLYQRINERTEIMIESGWLEEVVPLQGTGWEVFLREKKLIGYDDIFEFRSSCNGMTKQELIDRIRQKTRNYAKRQITYFSMLSKKLLVQQSKRIRVVEIDLTHASPTLYIEQVLSELDFVAHEENK